MPIAHLLELWKGIEVEPMEAEPVAEDAAPDDEPVKEMKDYSTIDFVGIECERGQLGSWNEVFPPPIAPQSL
ncbi:hypothetical protein AV530_005317 [Patagioenas fasciata monilis]|uniref:Uncharacterized protein n=1 Tax=Patagioenas fasciata monilis TaxID=372326 RepID=A0A1V4JKW6_PATFA|nr:hypothetical protein AV530_005317 [Patagioenas fasciata monilis]